MAHPINSLLQWNLRGLQANFQELQLLCHCHSPAVVALQETQCRGDGSFNFSCYNVISAPAQPTTHGVTGGVALLIHKSLLYSCIPLKSSLQALAARVSLHKTITVCTLYLPPSVSVN